MNVNTKFNRNVHMNTLENANRVWPLSASVADKNGSVSNPVAPVCQPLPRQQLHVGLKSDHVLIVHSSGFDTHVFLSQ